MDKFEKKNILELKKMTLEEVKKYYVELRKYEYEENIPIKGIEFRKNIHNLLLRLIKLERHLSKQQLEIINDRREKTDRPIIYACTHIGGDDVQRTFEAIEDHAYLFIGDLEELYRDLLGFILYLNGAICLETGIKEDRKIAKCRAIEVLKKNTNLLIYPEGAWNITANLPVMKLYAGAVLMAIDTNADIVPIAIEQYDDKFCVNIGKNMKITSTDVESINQELRDNMATLKWEIWEKNDIVKRKDVDTTLEKFANTIIERCPYGFTVEDVEKTRYKDETDITKEEVFSFVKRLT